MKTVEIAKICHEALKALCELNGDYTQESWEKTNQKNRDITIKGVLHRLNNLDAPVCASHDEWVKQKKSKGWVYGPEKMENAIGQKTHPSIVSFDKLSNFEKAKDILFVEIVKSLAKLELD